MATLKLPSGFGSKKKAECPLLETHLGRTRAEINCGVSIGLQNRLKFCKRHPRIERLSKNKTKIKPGRDIDIVEAVRSHFPGITVG